MTRTTTVAAGRFAPGRAGCLFAELGYRQVWHRLTAGLRMAWSWPTGELITLDHRLAVVESIVDLVEVWIRSGL
jgi:hypothetical protein